MALTVRTPEEDELAAWFGVNATAFGYDLPVERVERSMRLTTRERLLGAWEDGLCVGSAGTFVFEMSMPGEALPCAGVTWVGVLPTHRRRGVLTALMGAQLRQIREHGEPIAMLWASEAPIYGRFGYGLAVQQIESMTLERVYGRLRGHPEARGQCRLVSRTEALAAWPGVWDAVRTQRAGLHARSAAWWEEHVLPEKPREEAGASPPFLVSLEEGGQTIGYAAYRVKRADLPGGLPGSTLEVLELAAVDGGAEAALWEYVLGVDLVATVTAEQRPLDETLYHLLEDPRRLVRRMVDALFCRVMDPVRALEGRRYAAEGRVVLEVVDDFGGYAAGRFALECGPDGGRCVPTSAEPDLVLDAETLGALLPGQASALALWRAGRIAGDAAAVAQAERLFRWFPEPWAPEVW